MECGGSTPSRIGGTGRLDGPLPERAVSSHGVEGGVEPPHSMLLKASC
jgi:hypothetical protein